MMLSNRFIKQIIYLCINIDSKNILEIMEIGEFNRLLGKSKLDKIEQKRYEYLQCKYRLRILNGYRQFMEMLNADVSEQLGFNPSCDRDKWSVYKYPHQESIYK